MEKYDGLKGVFSDAIFFMHMKIIELGNDMSIHLIKCFLRETIEMEIFIETHEMKDATLEYRIKDVKQMLERMLCKDCSDSNLEDAFILVATKLINTYDVNLRNHNAGMMELREMLAVCREIKHITENIEMLNDVTNKIKLELNQL